MSHRRSKHTQQPRPLSSSFAHAETYDGRRWIVATMAAAKASKAYRCPGCQSPITPGTAHLVVWPDTPQLGSERAVDDRRHWHTGCWRHHP
ncbi:MAG: hypothetical protein LBV06_03755 [Propionibacteriaceae bacterium]|nr:hypothetical protein [Propionibacteriaceae bacterium]